MVSGKIITIVISVKIVQLYSLPTLLFVDVIVLMFFFILSYSLFYRVPRPDVASVVLQQQ